MEGIGLAYHTPAGEAENRADKVVEMACGGGVCSGFRVFREGQRIHPLVNG